MARPRVRLQAEGQFWHNGGIRAVEWAGAAAAGKAGAMFKNLSPEALGISGQGSELIELVMSNGFKGVDLDLVEFGRQVEANGFDKAARLIRSARLQIGSFVLPVRWQDDAGYREDMTRLEKLLPIARELGCARCVTLVQPGHDKLRYHENFEFHRRRLGELAKVLAESRMRLGLGFLAPHVCREPYAMQFVQTVDELMLLVSNIGEDNIGVAIDTWHWHLGGGTAAHVEKLGADQIVAVSVADAAAGVAAADVDPHARLVAGDGVIDLTAMIAALAKLKYAGGVTPTPDRRQLAGQGREAIVKRVGESIDALFKAAGVGKK
jgi:sugar phosphate isomerase/epimerase